MSEYLIPKIVDCACGRRFMRTGVATLTPEIGHMRCDCGDVVGAWNGNYRLAFEPEDASGPPSGAMN